MKNSRFNPYKKYFLVTMITMCYNTDLEDNNTNKNQKILVDL